ncbi:MAG TPA: hypothetical protein DCM26_02010 [Desulfotomaculum sp.]|nr:hypothetical protein [Desulfotomaculum sp.]
MLNIDHIQFNVVNTEDMRAAQAESEKYEDLMVRVAGYSARFIYLKWSNRENFKNSFTLTSQLKQIQVKELHLPLKFLRGSRQQ